MGVPVGVPVPVRVCVCECVRVLAKVVHPAPPADLFRSIPLGVPIGVLLGVPMPGRLGVCSYSCKG